MINSKTSYLVLIFAMSFFAICSPAKPAHAKTLESWTVMFGGETSDQILLYQSMLNNKPAWFLEYLGAGRRLAKRVISVQRKAELLAALDKALPKPISPVAAAATPCGQRASVASTQAENKSLRFYCFDSEPKTSHALGDWIEDVQNTLALRF
jgi:hypothetical protein